MKKYPPGRLKVCWAQNSHFLLAGTGDWLIFPAAHCLFKGTVSRDFRLLVFSWISFPQTPEYTIRAVSNFFQNSRRYSQLKVHHRCRLHRWQIKVLIILFGHLWEVELTYRYIFAFKFFLRSQQPDIVPITCRRCRWYWWCTLTCEYLREFSKKFETILMGYSGTGGKLIHEKKQKQKNS